MPLLIISAIGALVGYYIGNSKGRPVAGFVWGLLTGPVGWLVVGISDDMRRKCPECLGSVPEEARKCQHCGSDLSSSSGATVKCPHCNAVGFVAEDSASEIVCHSCGQSFSMELGEAGRVIEMPPSEFGNKASTVLILASILAINCAAKETPMSVPQWNKAMNDAEARSKLDQKQREKEDAKRLFESNKATSAEAAARQKQINAG